MPQPIPEPDVIPLSQAINKYFDLCMYFLVMMGFGTLASTGVLDWPAIVLVGLALAIRGYLLAERRRIVFSERWTTPLTIAYFIFYALDYFLLSRSFLTATVHLVLFAVVVRTFSLRRDRDYTTLAILAFLMVLASAVLTVDSVFLLFFAGFTLTAVVTFVLMEMRRSGKMARFQARHSRDEQEHRHLAFSLARITPGLVLMILAGAAAVFFLLPRMSAGYLGGYSFGTDISTGFSDHVQLGQIGQIQQSDAVVMHIQINGDQHGEHSLRWRGIALADFDGKNWSNPQASYALRRQPEGGFAIPYFGQGVAEPSLVPSTMSGSSARLIHYRVLMEPIGTNVFFLAPWARRISGAYRALERYLQSHYGYTLQLQRAVVGDPLANFLFVRKQGHCEYFASSMAVMLRTLRIPSRVVNGFRSDEFNDLTGNYVVRAKNAHSWVEAYFAGYGWVSFDPTPGGEVGLPQGWGRVMLYLDAAASFWREWVVSYDSTHQYMLGQSMMSGTRNWWERARMWGRHHYASLMKLARKSQRALEYSPGRWAGVSIAVLLLLLVLSNAARIAHMIRTGRLRAHPERSPDQAAVMWYEKMARYLARRGVRKSSSQTAQEFVRVIEDGHLRARVGKFTDAYESARFGDSTEDALRLPELYEEVEAATKQ
jgi:TgpA N-terminal domain/Transglutaminase-like superfamily/Domain of unknown function (DUF4129)